MKTRIRQFRLIIVLISLALLGLLWSHPPELSTVLAGSAQGEIEQAWAKAEDSGVYQFRTQVEQTSYPGPSLANVGRPSQTDRFALDGQIDRPQEQMTMTLYPNGSRNANNGLAVKIEGDEAFGQMPNGQWEKMENVSDVFAPGGDPLGYRSAATNIRLVGQKGIVLDDQTGLAPIMKATYSQYAFDLDGNAFANYVRAQMEAQLRERGELPAGVSLSTPELYRDADGGGEIWLDEAGLPRRMTAQLNLPPVGNGDRLEIALQTDFYNFDLNRIAVAQHLDLRQHQLA